MRIDIPKRPNYDVPEGKYRATLFDIVEPNKELPDCEAYVRFLWKITFPTNSRSDFRAGTNYCTDYDKCFALIEDVESLLGEEFASFQDEHGKLDLKALVGREADLVIAHIHNEKYEKPFVYVKGVYKPGTFLPVLLG